MAGNTFGYLFRLTSFGESHGKAIGGVIDGCPPGYQPDMEAIQHQLSRRRPGQNNWVSPRDEQDKVEWLSGMYEGKTTGTPMAFLIQNKDQRSTDYDHLKDRYRPSHADFTYQQKYGYRDHRGGGRSSARETAVRVVAGALAMQLLKLLGIEITAFVSSLGTCSLKEWPKNLSREVVDQFPSRCPDNRLNQMMLNELEALIKEGDTSGGVISCRVTGVMAGLGEPVFDKLHADLGKAILSINACKGFEIGSGFEGSRMKGSEHNDPFVYKNDQIHTTTNHSGGVQGGISNGASIEFRAAFKPIASTKNKQSLMDEKGKTHILAGKGRHDVNVVPRAVPIVEAMTALVLIDHYLRQFGPQVFKS